jgi:DNA-binding PadR family transcriptional regulator
MRSLVNWALLGLVIERPSYAYELAQRFKRAHGDALSLSSISHVYTALGTLRERLLVEEVPGTRAGRQPKPHYRATDRGIAKHQEWLMAQIGEDRQRQRIFLRQLGALCRNPEAALRIIDGFEQACLEEAGKNPIANRGQANSNSDLTGRLIAEESRLAAGAKLSWVQYARREFKALAETQAVRR